MPIPALFDSYSVGECSQKEPLMRRRRQNACFQRQEYRKKCEDILLGDYFEYCYGFIEDTESFIQRCVEASCEKCDELDVSLSLLYI